MSTKPKKLCRNKDEILLIEKAEYGIGSYTFGYKDACASVIDFMDNNPGLSDGELLDELYKQLKGLL